MPLTARFRVTRGLCAVACNGGLAVGTAGCGHEAVLAPGHDLTVALAPGRYAIASTVDADGTLGEQGTLTVTSK